MQGARRWAPLQKEVTYKSDPDLTLRQEVEKARFTSCLLYVHGKESIASKSKTHPARSACLLPNHGVPRETVLAQVTANQCLVSVFRGARRTAPALSLSR